MAAVAGGGGGGGAGPPAAAPAFGGVNPFGIPGPRPAVPTIEDLNALQYGVVRLERALENFATRADLFNEEAALEAIPNRDADEIERLRIVRETLADLDGNDEASLLQAIVDTNAEIEAYLVRARAEAINEETRVLGSAPIRELCTGRIPQHPVITSARIDPETVLGAWPVQNQGFPAEFYKCPPNVPLFTTKAAMEGGVGFNRNGKRFRADEYEECVPVIAHIPVASRLASFKGASRLVFVGMSYGSVSKNNVVAVVGRGLMPASHDLGKDRFHRFIGKNVWWKRSAGPYGSKDGPTIAVPALVAEDDAALPVITEPDADISTDIFDPGNRVGHIVVQSADVYDCALLIG